MDSITIDYSELLKYILPTTILVVPLLIPKIWDWWRESSKIRGENRRIQKKSLYQLLRLFTVLNECEYFLACKGFRVNYGIHIHMGSIPDQKESDMIMANIMGHYEDVVNSLNSEIEVTCNDLSSVQPLIALRLSMLKLEQSNMGEMKESFKLPFLPDNARFEIVRIRKEVETLCLYLSMYLDRSTRKSTRSLIEAHNKSLTEAIDAFENEMSDDDGTLPRKSVIREKEAGDATSPDNVTEKPIKRS